MEPLDGMMCGAPDDVVYASYKAVEGVVSQFILNLHEYD